MVGVPIPPLFLFEKSVMADLTALSLSIWEMPLLMLLAGVR
jgi:hypothetical protein